MTMPVMTILMVYPSDFDVNKQVQASTAMGWMQLMPKGKSLPFGVLTQSNQQYTDEVQVVAGRTTPRLVVIDKLCLALAAIRP